jgi:hypothetical protein
MSAIFIVTYTGRPVEFPFADLVDRDSATRFNNKADAWYAAFQADLDPSQCDVVDLNSQPSTLN